MFSEIGTVLRRFASFRLGLTRRVRIHKFQMNCSDLTSENRDCVCVCCVCMCVCVSVYVWIELRRCVCIVRGVSVCVCMCVCVCVSVYLCIELRWTRQMEVLESQLCCHFIQ